MRPSAEPPLLQDAARLAPALRQYFRRRRVATQDIDDLIQEVFIHLQSRRSTEAIAEIERYVFVVASNVLNRHHGREKRWTRALDPDSQEHEDFQSPERAVLGRDRLNAVATAIRAMPTRARQVFVLHRFEEMTYPRIAATLGISQSAVEKHMIRALKALNGLRDD